MRKSLAALILSALLICGCAGSHQAKPSPRAPVTSRPSPSGTRAQPQHCHPRTPPSMGECVSQRFGAPTGQFRLRRALGIDTSRWNGPRPNLTGVGFQIIQANYGLHVEPGAIVQMAHARAHHVPFGCYTFLEPGVSGYGQARLAAAVCTRRRGRTLGLWADAELPGTYGHTCTYTGQAKRLGVVFAGVYSAPGLYEGRRCAGDLWPAEWSATPAYPFGGYPASAIRLRQFCGTCFRYGVETDLDEKLR